MSMELLCGTTSKRKTWCFLGCTKKLIYYFIPCTKCCFRKRWVALSQWRRLNCFRFVNGPQDSCIDKMGRERDLLGNPISSRLYFHPLMFNFSPCRLQSISLSEVRWDAFGFWWCQGGPRATIHQTVLYSMYVVEEKRPRTRERCLLS